MGSSQTPRSFGTHDGTFHADEVSACALLLLCNCIDRDLIFRTRDISLLNRCEYVCDVGGIYDPSIKRFDHHQKEYSGPLSSAGMILNHLVESKKLSQHEGIYLKKSIIDGIDAIDIGHDPHLEGFCLFSDVISFFTPTSYDASNVEQDIAFLLALDFTAGHLRRMLGRYRYHQSCKETVRTVMEQYRDCLIFETQIPWLDSFFELDGQNHPAKFVIMPVGNQWKLRGIPPSLQERMQVRQPLPEEWAGLMDENLQQKTGIEGAIFCHKGRFISMWESREAALQALDKVLPGANL